MDTAGKSGLSRVQAIRIALILMILIIAIVSFLRSRDSAAREEIPETTSVIYTESETTTGIYTESEITSLTTESKTSSESISEITGTTRAESSTTESASEHISSETGKTTTATSSQTAEMTVTETTSVSTSKETTATVQTQPAQTTTTAKRYGPFTIEDISDYNIVDPSLDFVRPANDEPIMTDAAGRGIVKVRYTGSSVYKARVEKAGVIYNYDLNGEGRTEVYPLQMGSGEYRVTVLKQVSGTKYTVVASKTFTADIQDLKLVFLNSVKNVFWMPEMAPVTYARNDLISDILKNGEYPRESLSMESFRVLWSYIIANIVYDKDKFNRIDTLTGYIPNIVLTHEEMKGICYDYAAYTAGILRSFGVPAKLVMGYCPTYYGDTYHAWNQIYIDNRWITVDPTYDAAYYQAGYKVNFEKKASLYSVSKEY